jgi:hypothetical protein
MCRFILTFSAALWHTPGASLPDELTARCLPALMEAFCLVGTNPRPGNPMGPGNPERRQAPRNTHLNFLVV